MIEFNACFLLPEGDGILGEKNGSGFQKTGPGLPTDPGPAWSAVVARYLGLPVPNQIPAVATP